MIYIIDKYSNGKLASRQWVFNYKAIFLKNAIKNRKFQYFQWQQPGKRTINSILLLETAPLWLFPPHFFNCEHHPFYSLLWCWLHKENVDFVCLPLHVVWLPAHRNISDDLSGNSENIVGEKSKNDGSGIDTGEFRKNIFRSLGNIHFDFKTIFLSQW